jgi:tRNA(Ile)-lysidine synthase
MAHHRRDQAETFVLQAMRGAGPAGLSAMRAHYVDEHGVAWARPWLQYPREAVEAYVSEHRLSFIDDDSNADERFARNRFRLGVWPAWAESFPGAEAALAQAAHRAQEAQACLNELAEMDLSTMAPLGPLRLAAWSALSLPRRSNALHAWLSRIPQARVTRALLERLVRELGEGAGAPARWPLGCGELRRYRGELRFSQLAASLANSCPAPASLVLTSVGDVECPGWGGRLSVFPLELGGVAWSEGLTLTLRARQGSEQFQSKLSQPARSLKKQFQAAGVPEWERQAPLVFLGDALIFVPGLGVDIRVVAPAGVPQVGFRWEAV